MLYSIDDHHRTHTVRIREVSAWSGKYIHVGARAGWQVAPAQHSRQWILVQLSAESMWANRICAPCRGNRSRMRQGCLPGRLFTLHRSCLAIKWPGGAWLFLSGTPHRWYQTTCYHFNIFQRPSPWVLLGAHKIQECFPCPWPIVVNCNSSVIQHVTSGKHICMGPVHLAFTKSVDVEVRTNGFKLDSLCFACLLASQLQMCLKPGHWQGWSWARMDFQSPFGM